MRPHVRVFDNEGALIEACAAHVTDLARDSLSRRGNFCVALSGGTTPQALYQRLAQPLPASRVDWSKTQIFFGDERCVPPDHAESNFRAAYDSLLSRVPVPGANVHRIPCEETAQKAAVRYTEDLLKFVPQGENHVPRFDLVLLGLGTDGHVASLFPGTEILQAREPAAAVFVQALDAWRVSLTFPIINNARHVLLLAAGKKKAAVVRHALSDTTKDSPLPVQRVEPIGEYEWFLDADAFGDDARETVS